MKSVEKSARTQEEAIQAALEELNASISDVDIQVLEAGSMGLFGLFGSRPARVRVTLKADTMEDELDALMGFKSEPAKPFTAPAVSVGSMPPVGPAAPKEVKKPEDEKPAPAAEPLKETVPETHAETVPAASPETAGEEVREEAVRKPEPVRRTRNRKDQPRQKPAAEKPVREKKAPQKETAPVTSALDKPEITMLQPEDIDPQSPAGKTLAFLSELTRLMGVTVSISVGTDAEGNVYGKMEGDTLGILIGRRGETLDALQYLTSLQVNRGQDTYTRVTLDTENYRERREDTLIRLANRMANRAVKTGRRVSLEAMNPYERRIIHSALQANDAVDTHSEGEDPNRHVVITLKR